MGRTLTVKMMTGQSFEVPLTESMQLQELRQLLAQLTSVPAFQQRLILKENGKSRVLEDGPSLSSQGVQPNSMVVLVVEDCKGSLSILVRNDKGRSSLYEVRLTQKVAELKQQVSCQEHVPTDQFWLSFQGRPLEDQQLLGEYSLTSHSTVYMNLYLRGGQDHMP
ncbi:ubiquitin-like protein ISG15 [Erinaceus europaeus]|uniref:Ubiquitin-like protein ISG15 n=1 Tax=Erinaceus europaeus TaxID=9365 RepID=A0A1S2ZWT3_ERIEU|nr:ubiquitin-like protein ISG15 [Erinaceus europaeus]